jgi:hypothetical protein
VYAGFTGIKTLIDGTTNTMGLGEESISVLTIPDLLPGRTAADCTSTNGHGWLIAPHMNWNEDNRNISTSTVRYQVNERTGTQPGICNWGANSPIRSAHTGGANIGIMDGSVQFLSQSTAITILYALAECNDGGATGGF